MISRLIYRCPQCAGFDWLNNGRCIHCAATVSLEARRWMTVNGRREAISYWYDRVRAMKLPVDRNGCIYRSEGVALFKEDDTGRYESPCGLSAILYGRRPVATVAAALFTDRIELTGPQISWVIQFESLLSVTIESNVIILVDRTLGPLFLDFRNDSGKKWEDGIRRALLDYRPDEQAVEYFPRLRYAGGLRSDPLQIDGPRDLLSEKPKTLTTGGTHPLYALVRLVVRRVIEKGLRIKWSGLEHLPDRGAAVLLCNHSSFLDAILLEAVTPRNIWFMTKNSQYKGRFMTWFLGLAKSFPVRRYTVDLQAVRNAIRVVQGGHILGIFPEGERNWDNRMLPFKRGTMRLVLALGMPVIPVGISGAYGLMPRWTRGVKRVPAHIRFGKPLQIEPVAVSAQSEADINAVTAKIRGAIEGLIT